MLDENRKIPQSGYDILEDVRDKIKKRNKLLFSKDSACLSELQAMLSNESHRTLVLWALDCAQIPFLVLQKAFPNISEPAAALDLCEKWSKGEMKMTLAKSAILNCHKVAKQLPPAYASLVHGIGHAGATVHVKTHAIGLPIYELTAIVIFHEYKDYESDVLEKIGFYKNRLRYWHSHADNVERPWASFLLRDD